MERLIACPSCSQHVRLQHLRCPHCEHVIRPEGGFFPRTASAVVMGLALTACPAGDDEETQGEGSADSTQTSPSTTQGTESNTTDPSSTQSATQSTTMTTGTTVGEPEYGVPSTTSGPDETGSSSSSGGSTTIGEPEYGVPTTGE